MSRKLERELSKQIAYVPSNFGKNSCVYDCVSESDSLSVSILPTNIG